MNEAKYMDGTHAREEARGIASDAIKHVTKKRKLAASDAVNQALESWKLEHVAADGTVEVPIPHYTGTTVEEFIDLGSEPRRVPAGGLLPEQCAGPLVRCPLDLFVRLASNN